MRTEKRGHERDAKQRQESRVRTLARRSGYNVRKSRMPKGIDNAGEFMLVAGHQGKPVLGPNFSATLDEIEDYLEAEARGGSTAPKPPAPAA